MQRRKFGRTGLEVSLLGFGCMRLPTVAEPRLDSDVGNIDEQQAIFLIRHAIDYGVSYIDTAYNYHGGKSEVLVGKALAGGYRSRVNLATKLPVWLVESEADCDRILNEQLAKLGTDHVDMYLLHALNKNTWRTRSETQHPVLLDRARPTAGSNTRDFRFTMTLTHSKK